MPNYDVALILTVEADTYEGALHQADCIADGLGQEGENVSAVFDYERDNDGQRVLYLHDERIITGTPGTSGPDVAGYDSIESWAVAHGMTLEDALDAGVSQDDDDVIHIPGDLHYEGYSC